MWKFNTDCFDGPLLQGTVLLQPLCLLISETDVRLCRTLPAPEGSSEDILMVGSQGCCVLFAWEWWSLEFEAAVTNPPPLFLPHGPQSVPEKQSKACWDGPFSKRARLHAAVPRLLASAHTHRCTQADAQLRLLNSFLIMLKTLHVLLNVHIFA